MIPDAGRSTANIKQEIAESLEKARDEHITRPINITFHIKPDTPEMRNRKYRRNRNRLQKPRKRCVVKPLMNASERG